MPRIIHSMLSFKPQELLLNTDDFEYGQCTFMAMCRMKHIAHRQTGVLFIKLWLSFYRATDVVHGEPTSPLYTPVLFNTDCVGQIQNGWSMALQAK